MPKWNWGWAVIGGLLVLTGFGTMGEEPTTGAVCAALGFLTILLGRVEALLASIDEGK